MTTIIERIRERHGKAANEPVGVRAIFGKSITTEPEKRLVRIIANTDDVDLDREVVVPSGADTRYFRQNKSVFCDHDTRMSQSVAVLRTLTPEPDHHRFKAWKANVCIRNNPTGDELLTMISEEGVGASIGMLPTDYGAPSEMERKQYTRGESLVKSIVRAWEWLELSFTCFPCNVSCSASLVKSMDDRMPTTIERLLVGNQISTKSAELVGFRTGPMLVSPIVKTPRILTCSIPSLRAAV